ncbi:MAG: recombinase family protein [Clostridia bacterium]|jgi:DNA invertase Pin-like site-specific DNA recombinase|nr:recombinase family protein [Clostridia bacterium]
MSQYCLYLRKSRADLEAEERGELETLARHEKLLLELAKKYKYNIVAIYKEIVSGESIAARPVMQQLLSEVEQGMWTGVLVVEVERLARGDTVDQGIVAQTFKYSDTKIITPLKIYDPNNEYDEEYFEFGLFMSRREYKTINRRLQRGRIASVKEGKYLGSIPPYGYKRVKLEHDSGFSLEQVPDEAEIVKLIFKLYTVGIAESETSYRRLGASLIAKKLNAMRVPTRHGGEWSLATIRNILSNPVYIGKIRWNDRKSVKKMLDGKITTYRPQSDKKDIIIVDGQHKAIIDDITFYRAQKFAKENYQVPVQHDNTVKSPLAGVVVCGMCGRYMVRRPYSGKNAKQPPTLMCPSNTCKNVSSALYLVENKILLGLKNWLKEYELAWKEESSLSTISDKSNIYKRLNDNLTLLNSQLDKTYTLLEQGIYSTDVFLERSKLLTEKINNLKKEMQFAKNNLSDAKRIEESRRTIIPKVQRLLAVYSTLPDPKAKNDMLKDVLEKVVYIKKKGGRWGDPTDFEIVLYPRLPHEDDI